MEQEVQFVYGTWEQFQRIQNKDPGTLYFLDNNQVYKGDKQITNVHTVGTPGSEEPGFPETITQEMRQNYYISLATGEIRYVTSNLEYVEISKLQLKDIILNQQLIWEFLNNIEESTIQMPTLTVQGDTLIWTPGTQGDIKVLKFKN